MASVAATMPVAKATADSVAVAIRTGIVVAGRCAEIDPGFHRPAAITPLGALIWRAPGDVNGISRHPFTNLALRNQSLIRGGEVLINLRAFRDASLRGGAAAEEQQRTDSGAPRERLPNRSTLHAKSVSPRLFASTRLRPVGRVFAAVAISFGTPLSCFMQQASVTS